VAKASKSKFKKPVKCELDSRGECFVPFGRSDYIVSIWQIACVVRRNGKNLTKYAQVWTRLYVIILPARRSVGCKLVA